jgi:Ankyrin repeats (3 copies)
MAYSLADEIIDQNIDNVRRILQMGFNLNDIDEYGFTYLIEAAIADNIEIGQLLLAHGAGVNLLDSTGNSALYWTVENNNLEFSRLLLEHGADANAYNFAGQPVMTMPLLRRQTAMKKLLREFGARIEFAQDYVNTKLLGHMFELVGTANLISPKNEFVEVDFEGFFLEFSVGVIADSLKQFSNHYGARKLRRYSDYTQVVVASLERVSQLVKFLQYNVNVSAHQDEIDRLLRQEPLIMPIAYEGHAVTFIKTGNILAHCDRREDSRHYDPIMIYQVNNSRLFHLDFIRNFIFEKKSDHFINEELVPVLGLQKITELQIEAQISGNCSWANVEATIPTLLFILFLSAADAQQNMAQYKSIALDYFHQWREWNKNRALRFCLQSFTEDDSIRNMCKAEVLAAILFQRCRVENFTDQERIELIMPVLMQPPYKHVLDNYVRVYCYESFDQEGVRFLQMIKRFGYSER